MLIQLHFHPAKLSIAIKTTQHITDDSQSLNYKIAKLGFSLSTHRHSEAWILLLLQANLIMVFFSSASIRFIFSFSMAKDLVSSFIWQSVLFFLRINFLQVNRGVEPGRAGWKAQTLPLCYFPLGKGRKSLRNGKCWLIPQSVLWNHD